jgi:hypothetical protein
MKWHNQYQDSVWVGSFRYFIILDMLFICFIIMGIFLHLLFLPYYSVHYGTG